MSIRIRRVPYGKCRTPCWIVTNISPNRKGYIRVRFHGKKRFLHRIMYERWWGVIPAGLQILHHCDNPQCVNYMHLSVGTSADNNADKVSKGRHAYGERNGGSKLTERQVAQILVRLAMGENRRALARDFGIHGRTIQKIAGGELWMHIQRPAVGIPRPKMGRPRKVTPFR
jgi:HNH endonuclease